MQSSNLMANLHNLKVTESSLVPGNSLIEISRNGNVLYTGTITNLPTGPNNNFILGDKVIITKNPESNVMPTQGVFANADRGEGIDWIVKSNKYTNKLELPFNTSIKHPAEEIGVFPIPVWSLNIANRNNIDGTVKVTANFNNVWKDVDDSPMIRESQPLRFTYTAPSADPNRLLSVEGVDVSSGNTASIQAPSSISDKLTITVMEIPSNLTLTFDSNDMSITPVMMSQEFISGQPTNTAQHQVRLKTSKTINSLNYSYVGFVVYQGDFATEEGITYVNDVIFFSPNVGNYTSNSKSVISYSQYVDKGFKLFDATKPIKVKALVKSSQISSYPFSGSTSLNYTTQVFEQYLSATSGSNLPNLASVFIAIVTKAGNSYAATIQAGYTKTFSDGTTIDVSTKIISGQRKIVITCGGSTGGVKFIDFEVATSAQYSFELEDGTTAWGAAQNGLLIV